MTSVTRSSLAIAALSAALVGPANAEDLGIVVPAYFYPSSSSPLWPAMNDAAERVPLIAIMNPNSGPAGFIDSNYTRVVNELRAAGGTVIAYVATTYAAKPLSQVYAEIDLYSSQYNLDGIFLDEMSNTTAGSTVDHYEDIYNYIKGVDPNWLVMGNPGTTTQEAFMSRPTADNIVVFENFASNYPGYNPSNWNADYPRERLSHLVHTQGSSSAMLENVEQSYEQNAGYVYVTNDVLGNPWDTLPFYWDELVTAVETINTGAIEGDFNLDGELNLIDLELILNNPGAPRYDVSGNGITDNNDAIFWIENLLGSQRGDANLDRKVDLVDLSILASSFSQLGGYPDGDFNFSGAVNLIDLSILASNFGFDATTIPEPSGVLILLTPALLARRRTTSLS